MDINVIGGYLFGVAGASFGVFTQLAKNKGEMSKAQSDELGRFRAELNAKCEKLDKKIEEQDHRILGHEETIRGLRGELTTVRTDFASYRTLVRLMVVQINHGNPQWRDLAAVLTSDSEIDKILLNSTLVQPLPEVPVRQQKRILVVDDNTDARAALEAFLKQQAYNVVAVSTGTDAISTIERASMENHSFDLVLLDYAMPNMTGRQVLEVIRTGSNPPKVVFITGHPRELDDLQGEVIWTKPLDFDVLGQMVKDQLNA